MSSGLLWPGKKKGKGKGRGGGEKKLPELGSSIMEDASAGPGGGLYCTSVSVANDTGERGRRQRCISQITAQPSPAHRGRQPIGVERESSAERRTALLVV